jgi:hypothetical protein
MWGPVPVDPQEPALHGGRLVVVYDEEVARGVYAGVLELHVLARQGVPYVPPRQSTPRIVVDIAVGIHELDLVVFAVGDQNPSRGRAGNAVRLVEPRRLAPSNHISRSSISCDSLDIVSADSPDSMVLRVRNPHVSSPVNIHVIRAVEQRGPVSPVLQAKSPRRIPSQQAHIPVRVYLPDLVVPHVSNIEIV